MAPNLQESLVGGTKSIRSEESLVGGTKSISWWVAPNLSHEESLVGGTKSIPALGGGLCVQAGELIIAQNSPPDWHRT